MSETMTLLAGALLFATGLAAQQQPPERPQRPSAEELVAAYGQNGDQRALEAALICWRDSARQDSIVSGLIALEPTPQRVVEISAHLGGVPKGCPNPRLDAWFRERALETKEAVQLMQLTLALLNHPTPENVAVVRKSAFDTTIADDIRSRTLEEMIQLPWESASKALAPRKRVDLMADVYDQSGRIPEPWLSNQVAFLQQTPEVGYWRSRMTQELVDHPDKAGAMELLMHLGTDVLFEQGGRDTVWVAQFREAMHKIAANPSATADARGAAKRTLELMREKKM